ncbi:TetR/AcrR family transcriptional regulator [Maritalea mediterranea]|uniref:TetR/AcrR family transcriptional regulator n=1 Tax=Maritalea mediterranea TaxID=2909667 RepID=A0ABS9E9P5_9HYPH|nr:TetR/AcrR family transcriptional regulator [Maritalea mediterranea]MCF4099604.1 TetR/AcrR family transcriptional regulator [Maritalea mediterranea]
MTTPNDLMQPDVSEREQDIFDATERLLVKFGYDKTTVADIAREAGISKGAVYLHFSSKDELIEKMLVRAMLGFSANWFAAIEKDPQGGLIGNMYLNMLKVIDQTPLMAVIMRQDGAILGNYLKKKDNFFAKHQRQGMRHEFVMMMQQAGAIRPDLDPKVVAHIMDMISFGMVTIAEFVPAEQIPPTDDVVKGIADFMHRALTPEQGADSETGKRILRQIYTKAQKDFVAAQQTDAAHKEN